jgi:hypothetical protein
MMRESLPHAPEVDEKVGDKTLRYQGSYGNVKVTHGQHMAHHMTRTILISIMSGMLCSVGIKSM